MLHLYFGTDTIKVRQTALAAVATLSQNGNRVERVELENLNAGRLADMLGAASLFGETTIYLIDTPSEDADVYDLLVASLAELADSSNTVVVMEKGLLAAQKKKWQNVAAVCEEFAASGAGESFNAFSLADALLSRDKKTLWLLYTEAKQKGLSAEEIIGTLWWQLKTLRLAALTQNAAEAEMKDFPYNKAKRALKNFKTGDLEKLSASLLKIYHEGHGGIKDIDLGLEEWTLSV